MSSALLALIASAAVAAPPACGPTPPPGQPGCQIPGNPSPGPNGSLNRPLSVQISSTPTPPYPPCAGPGGPFPCVLSQSSATITSVSVSASNANGNPGGGDPFTTNFVQSGTCYGQTSCSGTAHYAASLAYLLVTVNYQFGTVAQGPDPGQMQTLTGRDQYLIALQPSPPDPPSKLAVSLTVAEPGSNDIFGVTLTVTNGSAVAFDRLTFPSGTGIVRDDSAAGLTPAGLSPLFAPSPPYPGALAGNANSSHPLMFEVTSPGSTRLLTRVTGRDASGVDREATAAVQVDATLRAMTPFESDAAVSGGLNLLLDEVANARREAFARAAGMVRKQIAKSKRPGTKALLTASKMERALAAQAGLPEDGLSFLGKHAKFQRETKLTPKRPSQGELAYILYSEGAERFGKQVGKGLDRTTETLVVTPFRFFRDLAFEPRDGDRARVGHELAATVREGGKASKAYLGEVRTFYSTPGKSANELWTELPKIKNEVSSRITKYLDNSEDRILRWDKLMHDNPREGMKQFAHWLADIEAGLVTNAVEDLLQTRVIDGIKDFAKARKAADAGEGLADGGDAIRRMSTPAGTRVARNEVASQAPIPGLGNLTPKQLDFFSSVLARLNKKFDVDIELQARSVNEYSAAIKDGVGKIEAIPTKNLTPDDVQMGAPEEWLGQTAYYKPELPTGYDKMHPVVQKRFKQRYDEKLKEYRTFKGELKGDKKSDTVAKALKSKNGIDVTLGSNYKAKMKLEAVEKDGATLIRYAKLEINGQPVFKGKSRAIVSDVDFNAVIDKRTGRHLPAGIRGQVELELMNEFSKAQREGLIPFGFHGWTHSGFDSKSTDYRSIAKYMLMYASEDQALRFARRMAPKFFPELGTIADPRKYERAYRKAVEAVLEGYSRGKHLVKITAVDATFGPGVDPNVGIPLPR